MIGFSTGSYTGALLAEWAKAGVKSVDVICPGFAADCLETLEEIAIENRQAFLDAGGERYRYIPALNDAPAHIDALADLIDQVKKLDMDAVREEVAKQQA